MIAAFNRVLRYPLGIVELQIGAENAVPHRPSRSNHVQRHDLAGRRKLHRHWLEYGVPVTNRLLSRMKVPDED